MYTNASGIGLGYVLMQNSKVVSHTSHQLKSHEKNYLNHDLDVAIVVLALKI